MFGRLLLALCCFAAACPAVEPESPDPLEQPLPNSTWLDFAGLAVAGSTPPPLPEWCESLQTIHIAATAQEPPRTIQRLRLRRLEGMQREMLFRIMFDDLDGLQPVVSAWTETGRELFRSQPLGTGIGLPSQDDVVIPLAGTDYVDLEVVGNGTSIRGALATALKEQIVRQPLDFQHPANVADPFGKREPLLLDALDTRLYGRVKAALEMESIVLAHGATEQASWNFELEVQPLAAIITFEVLNADLSSPPLVSINHGEPQPASVQWPDLADPGYRGEARGGEPHLRFQYTGWLRAQVVIPGGGGFRADLNNLTISLSETSGTFAVRNVELQLKQNWKHFDYILNPDR